METISSFFLQKSAERSESFRKMEDFKVIDNYLCVKLPEEVDHHKSAYICENADKACLTPLPFL